MNVSRRRVNATLYAVVSVRTCGVQCSEAMMYRLPAAQRCVRPTSNNVIAGSGVVRGERTPPSRATFTSSYRCPI
jgi:hypothetical protein